MPDYTTKGTAVVSLSAGVAKCFGSLITAATRRARLKRLTVGCLSVTASDAPGLIELVQFDADGTGTAVTPTALDSGETASITTSKTNYTVEPTTNPVVKSLFPLSPQGITAEKAFGPGEELLVPISKILGFRGTMPQAQSIWWEAEYSE
jgi:hypothetical protein